MARTSPRYGPPARTTGIEKCAAALLIALIAATNAYAAESPAKSNEPSAYAEIIKGARFDPDDVGFLVVDPSDGRVVAEHNADRLFIPASVAKVATIIPALAILGGDHRFATTLTAEGEVADGVLDGTLTLRGGGDPFLTGDDLRVMADGLAAAGIKEVKGRFVYDASALIEVPAINPTQPEAADYNSGVGALSVNFNRLRLFWRTDGSRRSASAATISKGLTLPLGDVGVAFADETLAGPFMRTGTTIEDRWLLSANLPDKGEDWLPVAKPSQIAADAFRAIAAMEGVTLPEASPGTMPDGAREIVRHDSVSLTDISRAVLRYSNNLSAELIGLAASQALARPGPSLAELGATLAAWWRSRLPDADWTGLVLDNHSGLSTTSRATPRQIVVMLEEADRLPDTIAFHSLMKPIAWKGVKGAAWVKTGTMSYVRGLAGYIDTASGKRLAFTLFFNDLEKRAALDASYNRHVTAIDGASRSWRNRALRLEEKLMTGWMKEF